MYMMCVLNNINNGNNGKQHNIGVEGEGDGEGFGIERLFIYKSICTI